MTHLWNHLAGVSLAGLYRLEEFQGGDESAVWYLTMSRSGQRAAIKLIPEESVDTAAQLGAWRATRLLSHSNLLPMFDCGRAETDGGAVLYAVFEYPDDSLASALQGGRLNESDARETLAAGLEALNYIHGRGFVHGAVDGRHILAVGERIKLASDTLLPAGFATVLPEDDIRALHRVLSIPYAAPANQATPEIPAPPVIASAPAIAGERPAPERELDVEDPARSIPNWAFGAAAGLVIAIVMAIVLKPTGASKPVVPQPQTTAPAPVAPAQPPPVSAPEPASRPASALQAQGRAIWRVVAYTYNHYHDAEKKAHTINTQWPGLHAAVYTPKGKSKPPYFVALGGRMTHAEALNLRHVARAKGLPRDTFVRNYSD